MNSEIWTTYLTLTRPRTVCSTILARSLSVELKLVAITAQLMLVMQHKHYQLGNLLSMIGVKVASEDLESQQVIISLWAWIMHKLIMFSSVSSMSLPLSVKTIGTLINFMQLAKLESQLLQILFNKLHPAAATAMLESYCRQVSLSKDNLATAELLKSIKCILAQVYLIWFGPLEV